jgi:putative membrane protein
MSASRMALIAKLDFTSLVEGTCRMSKLTTAAVAIALSCGLAFAQQGSQSSSGSQAQSSSSSQGGQLNQEEQTFLKHAIDGNMFEIKASEAAQQQAQDDQVKKFAQQMVQDHQQALDQLKQIAQSKGVQAPSDLSQPHQEELQAMQSLQGKDFDQSYISAMKAAHAKDVSKFTDKAAVSKDQDIKQFCAQIVPKLREHRQMVMQVAEAVGLPAGGGRGEARQAGARMEGEGSARDHAGDHDRSGSSDHSHGDHAAGSNSSDASGGTSGSSSGGGGSSGSSSQSR